MSLANKIKKLRLDRRMSLRKAALFVGTSNQSVLHGYETGKHEPTARQLRAICLAYCVSADVLLDLPERPIDVEPASNVIRDGWMGFDQE